MMLLPASRRDQLTVLSALLDALDVVTLHKPTYTRRLVRLA